MNHEEIKEKLTPFFSGKPEVECAYLFGSYAEGKERANSDVDIAVILKRSISKDRYTDLQLKYMDDLSRILHKEVDAVIFNSALNVLAYQVLKYGKRIYERSDRPDRQVEHLKLMEYFDFLPYRRRCEKAMLEHIKSRYRRLCRTPAVVEGALRRVTSTGRRSSAAPSD